MNNESTTVGIAKPVCRCCKVVGLIVISFGLILVVAGSQVGRWLEAPGQPASKADVIVILGGDTGSRLIAALEFYRGGLAPKLFLAGVESDDLSTYNPLLNLRLQYLLAQGVPREAIIVDRLSSNSWEEAANTLKLMRDSGWHKALVISDPPHLRRLSWVWSKIFTQADPAFILVASRPKWWHSRDWWHDEKSGVFVLMEVIKLGYYYAVR